MSGRVGQPGELWTTHGGGTLTLICKWPEDDETGVLVVKLLSFGSDTAGTFVTSIRREKFERMVGYLHDFEATYGELDLPNEARLLLDEHVTYADYHAVRGANR